MAEKKPDPWLPMSLEQEMKYIETLVIFDMFGTEGLENEA